MLKKLYDKSNIWFAVVWIIAYCVLMSAGDALSAAVGVEKSVTLAVGLLLSGILLLFLKKHQLFAAYGLCKSRVSARKMLYYLPLLGMFTVNLWYGVTVRFNAVETVLYILSMFAVGFLEEVIFRGLLFHAMRKDSLKAAVIVSSVSFGMGHIVNLLNGSGATLLPSLLQIVYATAAGFLFVMMYLKTDSLLSCIAAHSIFNALSVFTNDASATFDQQLLTAAALTVITGGYGAYLAWTMKKAKQNDVP